MLLQMQSVFLQLESTLGRYMLRKCVEDLKNAGGSEGGWKL
jgi:hypothetical protein